MDISKEERELYDRQIRLWGLHGQSRLRGARILVLGFEAVAVELVKNLALAGAGSIVLQSSHTAEEADLAHNFFLEPSAVGQNVAEASATALQRLNPRVAVTTNTSDLADLSVKYIADHDVVVLTQLDDKARLLEINAAARESDCAFFFSLLDGWAGFIFEDLGSKPHRFIAERELLETNPVYTKLGKLSPTREVVETQPPLTASGSNIEKLTIVQTNVSLADALAAGPRFGGSLKQRQKSKVSPYLPAFLAQLEGAPGKDAILRKTEELGLPRSIVTDEFLEGLDASRGAQLPALASVIGGLMAQEVINFLTLREFPLQNIHIYDGLHGKGPIYLLSV